MNFHLTTHYPSWYFLLCLALGATYSQILYFLEFKKIKDSKKTSPYLWLALLRFISVSLIAFFLLSPILKKHFKHIEKPRLIIASDNSGSILLNKDSIFYQKQYPDAINTLAKRLHKKYELKIYSFDSKVYNGLKTDFSGNSTDISAFLNYTYNQDYSKRLGAIILASDGNYNLGSNPVYSAGDFNCPFYTVALGDTAVVRDVLVSNVEYPGIVYLGNSFPFRFSVEASKCKNKSISVNLLEDNRLIKTMNLIPESADFDKDIEFILDADKTGFHKYTISLGRVDGEISFTNNLKEVFIEVLENKKRILLLASSPHPDIAAIIRCIEKNDNFQSRTWLLQDFLSQTKNIMEELSKWDVIVFHQLPSKTAPSSKLFEEYAKKPVPAFFIVGPQSDLTLFNKINTGLTIVQKKASTNEVLPVLNNTFSYFNTDENLSVLTPKLPPLNCPFGDYRMASESQSLFSQKIGNITTSLPLWVFSQGTDIRTAIICGDGIWKWPLIEFQQNKNQKLFEELIYKTINYLAVKADKRQFRFKDFVPLFSTEQPVVFRAELYNQNYEKYQNAEITMRIKNPEGKTAEFTFIENDLDYYLNAGPLSAGNYQYLATVRINGKTLSLNGDFIVRATDLESLKTNADHNLMYSLAKESGGEMYYPDQLDKLASFLLSNTDIKPVIFFEQNNTQLINLLALFFLILFLLSLEWFLRKFFGSY